MLIPAQLDKYPNFSLYTSVFSMCLFNIIACTIPVQVDNEADSKHYVLELEIFFLHR